MRFVFNSRVGAEFPLDDLEAKFDAVFLSLGTWNESQARINGSDLPGVFGSLHFLEGEAHGQRAALGDRVVIIGGGNSAIDCARTVIRKGSTATIVYRRERKDMPAIAEEVDAAEEEGVNFIFLTSPHRIVGENNNVTAIEVTKTRLGAYDTSGRRRPIDTGEILVVPCNNVILAVGESSDSEFTRAAGLALKPNGMLAVDRYQLTTSRPKVYAGGDYLTGASNVVTAMSYGKEVARSIDHNLTNDHRFQAMFPIFRYDQTPAEPSPCARHHAHFLPPAKRAKSFTEAVTALRADEAREEACRCLRCDIKETVAHAVSRAGE